MQEEIKLSPVAVFVYLSRAGKKAVVVYMYFSCVSLILNMNTILLSYPFSQLRTGPQSQARPSFKNRRENGQTRQKIHKNTYLVLFVRQQPARIAWKHTKMGGRRSYTLECNSRSFRTPVLPLYPCAWNKPRSTGRLLTLTLGVHR